MREKWRKLLVAVATRGEYKKVGNLLGAKVQETQTSEQLHRYPIICTVMAFSSNMIASPSSEVM